MGLMIRGVEAGVWGPHRSPVHRREILAALATVVFGEVEQAARDSVYRPSVVVVTGHGDRLSDRRDTRRPLVLGAADLQDFAVEVSAHELLAARGSVGTDRGLDALPDGAMGEGFAMREKGAE